MISELLMTFFSIFCSFVSFEQNKHYKKKHLSKMKFFKNYVIFLLKNYMIILIKILKSLYLKFIITYYPVF